VVPPAVIRDFVEAASSADGDRAGSLVTADAVFQIPGPRELPSGEAGASAFAAQHAESDGRKSSVELLSAEQKDDDRWVTSLRFSAVEVASGELQYEMTVGGIFTLEGDRISAVQAFPSYEEAVAAANS
jgi:limonene-1,2-epoxide hydrolase